MLVQDPAAEPGDGLGSLPGVLAPIDPLGHPGLGRGIVHAYWRIAPEGVAVYNPAFDVTPARLITAIVTEAGVARPPYGVSLAALSMPAAPSR